MKHFLLAMVIVSAIISLASCGDDDIPSCIDDRLEIFRGEACESTSVSPGGSLLTFRFRTETVYCFDWGACRPDRLIEIRDQNCELICELSESSISCDGVAWSTAVQESVIFQN